MEYSREEVLSGVNIKEIGSFMSLASVALILPFFIHIQWISGPIVNAILILTLFLVGVRSALVLCLVPSLIALSGGLLPAVLAPAVPFIMISNVILVLTIDYFYIHIKNNSNGYLVGVVSGAFIKFIFLFYSIDLVSKLLIKQELASKIAQLFSWTQFMTAITGALIAFVVLKWLKSF